MSPTSPRQIQIDPNLPSPVHHRAASSSAATLSPQRALGGPQHRGSQGSATSYRGNVEVQRQMQQDIDSALSMSRARSGSFVDSSPAMLRPPHPRYTTSPIEETPFGMLSDAEEREMDRARQAEGDNESDEGHTAGHYRTGGEEDDEHDLDLDLDHDHSRAHRRGHHDYRDSVSGSSGYDSFHRLLPARRGSDPDPRELAQARRRSSGHLRAQIPATPGIHNLFDFSPMEAYASAEREQLAAMDGPLNNGAVSRRRSTAVARDSGKGVVEADVDDERSGSPTAHPDTSEEHVAGGYSSGIPIERTMTTSAFGDETDPGFSLPKELDSAPQQTNFHRRRARKLSQSNPVRRQAKLALFEGFSGGGGQDDAVGGALKAPRAAKNLGATTTFATYTDATPSAGGGHDRPYRFSFYSNALPVTIHARTLAELPAEGQTFEELFKGRGGGDAAAAGGTTGQEPGTGEGTEYGSVNGWKPSVPNTPNEQSLLSLGAPKNTQSQAMANALAKIGGPGGGGSPPTADDDSEASTWWLDVLSPTDEEMRMLSKVFGIHPLTTEDILLEETREKIELFRNYYLVCFRSFDQDPYSQTYLEPLNMYIIVFREGTLSFHFRGTPHPQNVRRRIKHLKDYISVTSDWISYALIDDITDAFGPLIQSIEYEVDHIDEFVLILKEVEQTDMLRRIGTCRKKVMGLLRLVGSKADVVKGLAKRCNENWLVAPKSDIGLYLSDIQDHLITMTSNLNHYEKILSRSHSNYLAQISIEMTDANNQINDVLSKLTALGTVLIPMNLVTGLWGMNVHVPGQDITEGYAWFGGILGCLALFAILGAWATYKCFKR